jgi:hypothetical protein
MVADLRRWRLGSRGLFEEAQGLLQGVRGSLQRGSGVSCKEPEGLFEEAQGSLTRNPRVSSKRLRGLLQGTRGSLRRGSGVSCKEPEGLFEEAQGSLARNPRVSSKRLKGLLQGTRGSLRRGSGSLARNPRVSSKRLRVSCKELEVSSKEVLGYLADTSLHLRTSATSADWSPGLSADLRRWELASDKEVAISSNRLRAKARFTIQPALCAGKRGERSSWLRRRPPQNVRQILLRPPPRPPTSVHAPKPHAERGAGL